MPPLSAPGYHHSVYDIFSARLPVNIDYVNTNRDVPDSKFAGYRISGKSNLPDVRNPAGYPVRHYPAGYRIVTLSQN